MGEKIPKHRAIQKEAQIFWEIFEKAERVGLIFVGGDYVMPGELDQPSFRFPVFAFGFKFRHGQMVVGFVFGGRACKSNIPDFSKLFAIAAHTIQLALRVGAFKTWKIENQSGLHLF